jgi:hypothetical protein
MYFHNFYFIHISLHDASLWLYLAYEKKDSVPSDDAILYMKFLSNFGHGTSFYFLTPIRVIFVVRLTPPPKPKQNITLK